MRASSAADVDSSMHSVQRAISDHACLLPLADASFP